VTDGESRAGPIASCRRRRAIVSADAAVLAVPGDGPVLDG
jgi:hypothetical protein